MAVIFLTEKLTTSLLFSFLILIELFEDKSIESISNDSVSSGTVIVSDPLISELLLILIDLDLLSG